MPNNASTADHVTDFQRLLQSVDNNPDILPDVDGPHAWLHETLQEMTEILALQDAHRAGLQANSKRLRELMVRGADFARQVRSLIRGRLGPRNDKLVEFRIPVLGRPRALPSVTQPPPPPEAPAPDEVKS
ncbi:MAG TPA: hypothetical protein VF179_33375 [Thermoanaerobaculia bacterium]|nr:hypothetical protein [Thermoanaerobaculia bacterium]